MIIPILNRISTIDVVVLKVVKKIGIIMPIILFLDKLSDLNKSILNLIFKQLICYHLLWKKT